MLSPRFTPAVLAAFAWLFAGLPAVQGAEPPQVPDQVVIKFRPGATQAQKDAVLADLNAVQVKGLGITEAKLERINGISVADAVARYSDHAAVQFIEPNYIVNIVEVPNDPRFTELWGMRNTGQTGGTPGADIKATAAWDVFTGSSSVLVGVIDTGVDYTHPDLAANIWTNPGEIPGNGIDDDGNGFIDDVHGWDFVNNDNDPMDDHFHGTHVSGTIGGVGNNGLGVAGVNWSIRIMALKFLNAGGSGTTADAIEAVNYATMMGVRLTSNSWGGGGYSEGLREAIADAGAAGILFVAAAGNYGEDTDVIPFYPSGYDEPNIVSVAATDHNDALAYFSNYGATTVDLAAPGVNILSTVPGGSYGYLDGTSMATPHVSGVLALIMGRFPGVNGADAKNLLLAGVDPIPALAGRVLTGGRLNAFNPIAEEDSIPPGAITDLAVVQEDGAWIRLGWTATGDDGTDGLASRYEVRYATVPIDEGNFESVSHVPNTLDPGPAGTPEELRVDGLDYDTDYYFAVKALDEFGTPGPISNVPMGTTIGPPDIVWSPSSFSDALFSGESATHILTLENHGEGELAFSISTAPVEGATGFVPEIARVFSTDASTLIPSTQPVPPRTDAAYDQGGGSLRAPLAPPEGAAAPSTGGLNLLLLNSGADVTEIRPLLEGFPDIATVDVFDGGASTPTAADLMPYDAVIVMENLSMLDPVATGDALADYADTGGGVILTLASFIAGWQIEGRFLSGGYSPFTVGSGPVGSAVLAAFDSSHPIMDGVTTAQGALLGATTVAPGGELVAQWSNGQPFVATQGTNVVGMNIFLNAGGYWIGDIPLILHNAALWCSSAATWLSGEPASGVVPGGESLGVVITADAAGLNGGEYDALISVESNDPDQPVVGVPAHLSVTGAPDIALSGEEVSVESQQDYFGSGASTTHSLPVTVPPAGGGWLDLTGDGDHADASETSTAIAEGTTVGSVGGVGTDCLPAVGSFALSPSLLSSLVADGTVNVVVQNSAVVDAFCAVNRNTVRLRYAGPADAVDFGGLFVGAFRTVHLNIENTGTEVLNVTAISVDSGDFLLSASSATLAPGESEALGVTYHPTSPGPSAGTLTVLSDDPDEGTLTVQLSGEGLIPPVIGVSPDSLAEALFSGEMSTRTLTVSNTGGSDLTFTSQVFPVLPGAVSVPFAGLSAADMSVCNNPRPEAETPAAEGPVEFIGATGDFEALSPSPVPLTCVVADPSTGLIYAQQNQGTGFYRYRASTDAWEPLTGAPISSGNNGGAALLNDKIYTVYTSNPSQMGVYDIAAGTWSTIGNPLGSGTGNIASDGSASLYLVYGSSFVRFDPASSAVTPLSSPPFPFDAWGGLKYLDGGFYGHDGNGGNRFARYDVAANSWTPLPSIPGATVLGSTIDPGSRTYYAYGSYGGNNLYSYAIDSGVWSVATIPFFSVNDGGLGWLPFPGGVYFVQGEGGTGLARLVTALPFVTVDPQSGTVPPTGSVILNVGFDATGLNGGDYDARIVVASNDPIQPEVQVPAHLAVTGAPNIAVSGEPVTVESSRDYSGGGAFTSHTLPISAPPSGAGELELIATGNYGIVTETATAVAEGTVLGTVGGTGLTCGVAVGVFPVGGALLSSLVADGVVEVTVQNSGAVDAICPVNNHTVRLTYPGPADALDFGPLFVGVSRTLHLTIRNVGSDQLDVTSIATDSPEFQVSAGSAVLAPGEGFLLGVTYEPAAVHMSTGTLTVVSNDPDQGSLEISLSGEGVVPPEVTASPDSLSEALYSGETSTQVLTVGNTGGSDLTFSVEVLPRVDGAISVPFAGLSEENASASDNPPPEGGASAPGGGSEFIQAAGDFEPLSPSPVPLTCVVADPSAGFLYGQENQGTRFYRYRVAANVWEPLAGAPLSSGNNGGAALLNNKIYTVYTGNYAQMGVYDIAANSWTVIANPLGTGTGNIASDGSTFLYLVQGTHLMRFNPATASGTTLSPSPFYFEPWGGLQYLSGKLYGHQGNGGSNFGRYDVASNSWTTLPSAPGGVVLGSAIDTRSREYFAYGSYGGTNLYRYSIDSGMWSVSSIPFFSVGDGGMGWLPFPGGLYFVQGELGTGLARLVTAIPFVAVDPLSGTVPPSGSTDLDVTFDAVGVYGGDYEAMIRVNSNDPARPAVDVPAHLTVTGVPLTEFSPESLDFGEVLLTFERDLSLEVKNVGTEILNVSAVTSGLPDYTFGASAFSIPPGTSRFMTVRFRPVAEGDRSTTLTFVSDDPHSPRTVPLTGTGILPPIISATPDSIVAAAMPGGTASRTLEICNSGGSDLRFSIGAPTPPPPPPLGPKLAVHVKSHAAKTGQICLPAESGGASPTDIPCSNFVTQASVNTGTDIYLVAAGAEEPGVAGVSCGIDYDPNLGQGVDMFGWYMCADGLGFPSDTWPASGAGIRLTWVTCQNRHLDPDGIHAVAGAFYVYAYSADAFRVTENFTLDSGPELKIANCLGAEIPVPVTSVGTARFSPGGTLPGFNPCLGGVTTYDGGEQPKEYEDTRVGIPVAEGYGGPDNHGYRWIDSDEPGGPAFDWVDIQSVGTQLPIQGDDANSGLIPIGFEFPYYDDTFDQFSVCTNGWISFTSTSATFSNQPLPASGAPENLIAPFWDDLFFSSRQAYYYQEGGRLIVQFQNVIRLGGGSPFTFEVILNADGSILFQYLSMQGIVTSATVGIQNATRDDGLTVAFDTPYLHDNLAVRFGTGVPWMTITPTTGVVPPGGCLGVGVALSALGLGAGDYMTALMISSNDIVRPLVTRPVIFHVGTVSATDMDADPDALNAGSQGHWVTASVELPPEYDPADVVLETVRAMGTVPADSSFDHVGDFNENGIPDRTFKFDRGAFIQALPDLDSVEVVITGEIRDRIYFVARDSIRVLRPHLQTMNDGGTFLLNTFVDIRWDLPRNWEVQYANILGSVDGGVTWTPIASGVTGQQYTWQLPDQPAEAALVSVYVYGADGLMGYDRSDATFEISGGITGVTDDAPPVYGLLQNVPNPFLGSTAIAFTLAEDDDVTLTVFDLSGRVVRRLVDESMPAGRHQVAWDGRSESGVRVASGLYLYRMVTNRYVEARRMFLLR